jgi:hypothetical protein
MSVLLRILAVVALVQGIAHGTLFIRARPTHGESETAVVEAMRSNAFRFAAAPRTYWDMYFGYGLEAAALCIVEAVLFWLLAGAAAREPVLIARVAVLFAVANVAHLAMLARYFAFPVPMAFDAFIAAGLVAVAWIGYSATPMR